jgi:hypothetical protein
LRSDLVCLAPVAAGTERAIFLLPIALSLAFMRPLDFEEYGIVRDIRRTTTSIHRGMIGANFLSTNRTLTDDPIPLSFRTHVRCPDVRGGGHLAFRLRLRCADHTKVSH